MNFWDRVRELCLSNTDRETAPGYVTVSVEERRGETVRLSAVWMEERERSSVLGELNDGSDDETMDWPVTENVDIDSGSTHDRAHSLISDVRSDADIPDEYLRGVTLFGPEATTQHTDSTVTARLWVDYETEVDHATEDVVQLVSEDVRNMDDTVESENVSKVSATLSDMRVCHVCNVRAKVSTQSPIDYISDVETVKGAAEIVAEKDDTTEQDVLDADGYIAPYMARGHEDEIPDELRWRIEEDVKDTFNQLVQTDRDVVLEGEQWTVNRFDIPDSYYSFASGFADCDYTDVGRKSVSFWVYVPYEKLGL